MVHDSPSLCGNLKNLSIRVDFASIVSSSDQQNHSNANLGDNGTHSQRDRGGLRTLTVGNSPLPDTPRCEWTVALALAAIFPTIEYLFSYRPGEMGKRWNGVWGDIPVRQKIFRLTQAEGNHLRSHRLCSAIPIPMRPIQMPPWFCKLMGGSHRPQITPETTGIVIGCGTRYPGVPSK